MVSQIGTISVSVTPLVGTASSDLLSYSEPGGSRDGGPQPSRESEVSLIQSTDLSTHPSIHPFAELTSIPICAFVVGAQTHPPGVDR